MASTEREGAEPNLALEWLETDGRGGFASGTTALARTRRYHALLLASERPPTHRYVLVNGLEAWIETSAGRFAISSQIYAGEVVHPDGARRIERFRSDPWPCWTFRLPDGITIEQEVLVCRKSGETLVRWQLKRGTGHAILEVRPLLSGRPYHALHHQNPRFAFEPESAGKVRLWRPYPGVPAIGIGSNAAYVHDPQWYRNFFYREEHSRGLDDTEDLASPGIFRFELSSADAVLLLRAGEASAPESMSDPISRANEIQEAEFRRRSSLQPVVRSAEDYVVRRGDGCTLVAGYPWFTDWGRDTFIAMRGLCLATGRIEQAREILLSWSKTISEGMLPNRFPDEQDLPEYGSVDASLWFVVAVHELITASNQSRVQLPASERKTLLAAIEEIVGGYARGTRFGIRADRDGLLAAGQPGIALTWMDAVIGGVPVTPRTGKPVEVQALWINALKIAGSVSGSWGDLRDRALASFHERFWNEEASALRDVIDCGHVAGRDDPSFRPNQIFAVGGLPFSVLSGGHAAAVVESVQNRLWTPIGLRSLAPDDPRYVGSYRGDSAARDAAYHQGTVWPWLLGAFAEAWVRVRGGGTPARRQARKLFLEPLLARVGQPGIGHLPEVADGDEPHRPGGCPFQAWSLAEALRLDRDVLAETRSGAARRERASEREIRS